MPVRILPQMLLIPQLHQLQPNIVRRGKLFMTAQTIFTGFFTTMVALGIFLYKYFDHKPHETLSFIKAYIYIIFGLCIFGILQIIIYIVLES